MASRKAHIATGWAAGLMAAAMVTRAGTSGAFHVWAFLSLAAGILGSTAPDWLEVAFWTRRRKLWIRHRTATHWGLGWIGLLLWSYYGLQAHAWSALTLGFAAGGIMHLLSDTPNPRGIPWIYKHRSLNLWASGDCDCIVVGVAWIGAGLFCDAVWFNSIHTLHAYVFLRDLPIFSGIALMRQSA